MRKILILTYFFPPGNFAGSYRLFSWAKYLHKFGYYPIVVTRHWNKDQTDYAGISIEKEITIEKHDTYEVHNIPYKGNLRDRLKAKYGNKLTFLTKFLSLFELIFQNFFTSIIPSRTLYYYAQELITKDPEIKYLFASGKPYILFRFGHFLKKEFPYLRWIADYRDPWNTHWWLIKKMPSLLKRIESNSEKMWLSNADAFTTCSEEWKADIQEFTKKKGFVVYNGYEEDDKIVFANKHDDTKNFTIVHNGSIYGLFPLDVFVESIKQVVDNGANNIRVCFPGILIDENEGKRLETAIRGYEKYFVLQGRIPHSELMEQMKNAQLLVVFGTKEMSGWIPLKLFEYLIVGKPILHCPGDDDVITKMICETKTGFVTYSVAETVEVLHKLYINWQEKKNLDFNPNQQVIAKYSRLSQTSKLVESIQVVDQFFSVPSVSDGKFRDTIFKTAYLLKLQNILRLTNTKSDTLLLCFHDISDIPNPSYPSMPSEQFERIIDYLAHSYEFGTLDSFKNKQQSKKTQVLLTFDDGYKSFHTTVIPILKKYNATAICSIIVDTVESGQRFWTDRLNACLNHIISNYPRFSYSFEDVCFDYNFRTDKPDRFSNSVFSNLLEKPSDFRSKFVVGIEQKLGVDYQWSDNFMSWADIKHCVEQGMEIASHSRTHNILNTIIKDDELRNEIQLSKTTIEEHTHQTVKVFTCPNGIYNEKVVSMVTSAGYQCMFTTEEHKTKQSVLSNKSLSMLPRISVNKSSVEENIFKINNFFSMAKPLTK